MDAEELRRRNERALYLLEQMLGNGTWNLWEIRRALEGNDR